jgi:hypothetical protein
VTATAERPEGLAQVSRLLYEGRCEDALVLVDRIIAGSDGATRAAALVQRLSVLLNLRRGSEYAVSIDAAFEAARAYPSPVRHGLLHAYASHIALAGGSFERCVVHLVLGARALAAVELADAETVHAWRDLAVSYSYAGFHGHALSAAERARQLARGALPLVMCNNRVAVTSLREIALGRVSLREPLETAIRAHIADRQKLEGERRFSNGRRRP